MISDPAMKILSWAELEKLTRQIAELKQEKENYEFLWDQALQEKEITISELDWYSNLRSELKKYSIPIDDTSRFAIPIFCLSLFPGLGIKVETREKRSI